MFELFFNLTEFDILTWNTVMMFVVEIILEFCGGVKSPSGLDISSRYKLLSKLSSQGLK